MYFQFLFRFCQLFYFQYCLSPLSDLWITGEQKSDVSTEQINNFKTLNFVL